MAFKLISDCGGTPRFSQIDMGLDPIINIQITGIQRADETLGVRLESSINKNNINKIHNISAIIGGKEAPLRLLLIL